MSAHTPGPWELDDSGATVFADDFGTWIATCADAEGEVRDADDTERANARLIAAAPDLLAACINALAALFGTSAVARANAIRELRAVIAKAEGRE